MTNPWDSQLALVVKNPPADAGDMGDTSSIPGSGRSPGGGNGNPLQYSCLGNSMDRGAWRATVRGVAKSHIQLKQLSVDKDSTNTIIKTDFTIILHHTKVLY